MFVDHNREAVRGLFGRRGSGPGDGALDGTAGWVQVAVLGQVVEGASVGGARILAERGRPLVMLFVGIQSNVLTDIFRGK